MNQTVKNFRDTFGNWLLSKNIRISQTVNQSLLNEFFKKVHPVDSGHSLVRLGGDGDGGYLVPDDLEGVSACFSPGVLDVASFELAFAARGVKSYLADYSVESAPVQHELIDFEKKYLGSEEDNIFMTLDSWIQRKEPNQKDFVLQMDIEGAEYDVIYDINSETLKKFRILVIEFHRLDSIFDKTGYKLINLTFSKLLKDFEIVHIHPNNVRAPVIYKGFEVPPLMEFTFLRKDRLLKRGDYSFAFPHSLDRPCVKSFEDYSLPRCWRKSA
jgi:hypothetical protein